MRQFITLSFALGLCAGAGSGASVQLNYIGAAFDAFSYLNTSSTPDAYALRGSYGSGHQVSAAIVIGDALPSNARVQTFSPSAYSLTTGAAIAYTLDIQSVTVSDGINTYNYLDGLVLDTDASGQIVAWDFVSYRGGPDFQSVSSRSGVSDKAEYNYTYQYFCPPNPSCQTSGWGLGGEVASASTTQTGSWSIGTALSLTNSAVTAAPVPVPAGGVLLLSGLGIAAFGRRAFGAKA